MIKINSKKGALTRDIIIIAILFTGIIGLLILGIVDFSNNYDQTDIIAQSKSFDSNYNKLNDLTDSLETTRKATQSGEGLSFKGTFDVAFQSTFTVIRLVFLTLDLYGSLAANIIPDFPFLDSSVVGLFMIIVLSLITVFIVFAWISSISRGKL